MPRYIADCSHFATYHKTVIVEADDLDTACADAIEKATQSETWRSADDYSQTRVAAIAEGEHSDPWGEAALPVPDHYSHAADLPLVRLTAPGAGSPPTAEVVRGRVLLTFADPRGTITAERPAPNVPAQAKPLVTVRIRPEDGRPDVTVTGGDARIRIVD